MDYDLEHWGAEENGDLDDHEREGRTKVNTKGSWSCRDPLAAR